MLKKSGIILAVLVLSTFALASSASAQTPQVPAPAVQAVQPVAPAPAFQLAPAIQTPAMAPANGSSGLEWLASPGKPACRCTTKAQCGGGACCWWPKQTCGICC